MNSVETTLFAKNGTLTTGSSLDCLAQITGDFANDAVLEWTIWNDTVADKPLFVSTESATDVNAFKLNYGKYITMQMHPASLFIYNTSGNTVTYQLLFKLRKASD